MILPANLLPGCIISSIFRISPSFVVKSAALLVVHEQSFPLVDLRVEFDRAALAELRFLWETYRLRMERFVTQVIDPDSLPYPEV